MTRLQAAVVAAFAMVAVVVWFFFRSDAEKALVDQKRPEVVTRPNSAASAVSPDSKVRELRAQVEAPTGKTEKNIPNVILNSDYARSADRSGRLETKKSAPEPKETEHHAPVDAFGAERAGIPFPISQSVVRYCEQISELGSADCSTHLSILAQLEKENRDSGWASAIESAITSIVKSDPAFRIRALECRTSVCALEIESIHNARRLPLRQLSDRLSEMDFIIGYESNDRDEVIKVSSFTFKCKVTRDSG